jgi:hypothetical protein
MPTCAGLTTKRKTRQETPSFPRKAGIQPASVRELAILITADVAAGFAGLFLDRAQSARASPASL